MRRIFIAGHKGMVGSAILRRLRVEDDVEILTADRAELDLLDQKAVNNFFHANKIDQVFLAAAKVGGINHNNTHPAEFIFENLQIQNNVIHSAHTVGVERLMFLGSSCIYPKFCNQPIKEDYLLTGTLEPTNEPYSIAKIAGLKMCESYVRQFGCDFRSVMPTNLYGVGDKYEEHSSHVIPALIRKFHLAKQERRQHVEVWGSGTPCREFLFVDDLAEACVLLNSLSAQDYRKLAGPNHLHINIGSGADISIHDLAELIKNIVGFEGNIIFDITKPDGTPKKLLDTTKINSLGWTPSVRLEDGLRLVYDDYLSLTA